MDARTLSAGLSVGPQITPEDIATLASQGIRTIICNRPDGEAEGQPPFARIAEAAEASGIEARCLPVTPGRITDADVTAFARVLSDLPGPAHAYCRTGTRSAMLWAMTMAGTEPLEDIVASTGAAGYDLGPLMPRLSARDATPG